MTRVALVAPVLSTAVPDLGALLTGDPYAVRDDLARDFGRWTVTTSHEPDTAALIQEHESAGASLLPDRLLLARRDVPDAARAQGVDEVLVSVGLHGVVTFVMWLDVDEPTRLDAAEAALCGLISMLAHEVREHLLTSPAVVPAAGTPTGRFPRNGFLYWHRVVCGPDGLRAWSDRLCNDVTVTLHEAATVRLGDGYTSVSDEREALVQDVLRGLVDAQELWLTVTTVSQQVLLETARLTRHDASRGDELADERRNAADLADREALRNGVLRDQIAYATGTRRSVMVAAAEAWRLELDTSRVTHRLEVLLHVLDRRIGEQQARQQERLNRIVLALTFVGALALLLGLFETGVGQSVQSLDRGRLVVSTAVGALALASIASALLGGRRRTGHRVGPPD